MSASPEALTDSLVSEISEDDLAQITADFIKNGKTLRELKGVSRDELEAVYQVAYQLYSGGDYEKARKLFEFLCFFDHLERKYWLGMGGCRQMLKQYEPAIEAYSLAMLLDSNDPLPPFHAAECHIALGNRDAAISGLTAALEWSTEGSEHQALRERAKALRAILEESAPAAAEEG